MFIVFLLYAKLLHSLAVLVDYTENGDTKEYSDYMNNGMNVYDELFSKRNYNKNFAPVFESMLNDYTKSKTERMPIHYLLTYVKIFDLDAEKQMLSTRLEMTMTWRDPRLAWDETKFDGVKSLLLTDEVIWIPDTCISNAMTFHPVIGQSTQFARVYSNGTILMSTAYYAETACNLNVNNFPFDRQSCPLPILSLNLELKWIELKAKVDDSIVMFLVGNGEWEITRATVEPYPPEGSVEIVGYLIMMKRVPNFYVYVNALPCFIMTALSVVGMFWSPNIRKEQLPKLSIGLTSLVSMTVLLDLVARSIPKTKQFPLLGIYVVGCVGITAIACVAVGMQVLPNPEKPTKKDLEEKRKQIQKNRESKSRLQLIGGMVKETIWCRHFFLQFLFQSLNIVGFIVFLSFWD